MQTNILSLLLQTGVVTGIHGIPRFGHSTTIAKLVSTDEDTQDDYKDGVSTSEPKILMCSCFLSLMTRVSQPICFSLFDIWYRTCIVPDHCLSIFLSTLVFTWLVILLILKYHYSSKVVGCAAGGDIVNVRLMRKQKFRKSVRKQRIPWIPVTTPVCKRSERMLVCMY
jgi:hypothetical protein